jgi:DNA-binding transcriptional ArsR family regulator
VENESSLGDLEVNGSQRVNYVGVATNFSWIRSRTAGLWLLPDSTLRMDGEDYYIEHSVLRDITETYSPIGQSMPGRDTARLVMRSNGTVVQYNGPWNGDPLGPWGEREMGLEYAAEDGQGVGYERVGPVNMPTGTPNTDRELGGTYFIACTVARVLVECVDEEEYGVIYEWTPNVTLGFEWHSVAVATDPANLTRRTAENETESPQNASIASNASGETTLAPQPSHAKPPTRPPDEEPPEWEKVPTLPRPVDAPTHVSTFRADNPAAAIRWPVANMVLGAVISALLAQLYSRFTTRDEMLKSQVRQRILSAISTAPGLNLTALAERLSMRRTALDHHLRMLEAAGCVSILREEGRVRVFNSRNEPASIESAHPVRQMILALLSHAGGRYSRRQLAVALANVPERTRNHNVRALVEAGRVRIEFSDRQPWLVLNHRR